MNPAEQPVTQLLRAWSGGDKQALADLMPIVYGQLRSQAQRYLLGESSGHTLRATALVHEAYVKLIDVDVPWQDRVHFFALASRLMRRILVDHAKTRDRIKRGAGVRKISLEDASMVASSPSADIVDLDDALTRLAEFDERKSKLIDLIYFGGLTTEEAAQALDISLATLHRELKVAKVWLAKELGASETV